VVDAPAIHVAKEEKDVLLDALAIAQKIIGVGSVLIVNSTAPSVLRTLLAA
jgi:hypothetical protein